MAVNMPWGRKERIEKNLPLLIEKLIDFDKVLKLSVEKKILDERDVIELKKQNISLDEKKRTFFIKCLHKEVELGFYPKFMGVFMKSRNFKLLNIMFKDQKDNQRLANENDLQQQNDPTDETFIHELQFIDKVEVKHATKPYNGQIFNEKYLYKMNSNPRGFALIYVNEFFDISSLNRRKGAEKDLDLMTQLLKQMGYKILSCKSKTKPEFEKIVENFTLNPALEYVDSCIVAISSHGKSEGINCKDGLIYPIERLKSDFNNKNCPKLIGKPKIFIIQSCRGDDDDYGVPIDSKDNENHRASVSDLFIFRPCQDGFASHLNPIYGSWLFYSVVDVFMNFACQDELIELIKKVHRKMAYLKSTNASEKQAPEFSFSGELKNLYFNPGL